MSNLPNPGEVWGHPADIDTWRRVNRVTMTMVYYDLFGARAWCFIGDWPAEFVRIAPKTDE